MVAQLQRRRFSRPDPLVQQSLEAQRRRSESSTKSRQSKQQQQQPLALARGPGTAVAAPLVSHRTSPVQSRLSGPHPQTYPVARQSQTRETYSGQLDELFSFIEQPDGNGWPDFLGSQLSADFNPRRQRNMPLNDKINAWLAYLDTPPLPEPRTSEERDVREWIARRQAIEPFGSFGSLAPRDGPGMAPASIGKPPRRHDPVPGPVPDPVQPPNEVGDQKADQMDPMAVDSRESTSHFLMMPASQPRSRLPSLTPSLTRRIERGGTPSSHRPLPGTASDSLSQASGDSLIREHIWAQHVTSGAIAQYRSEPKPPRASLWKGCPLMSAAELAAPTPDPIVLDPFEPFDPSKPVNPKPSSSSDFFDPDILLPLVRAHLYSQSHPVK